MWQIGLEGHLMSLLGKHLKVPQSVATVFANQARTKGVDIE